MSADCPFCEIAAGDEQGRITIQDDISFVVEDHFPISEGHSLIIPKRHVGSFFDATADEQRSLLALLSQAKQRIDAKLSPDSYNIGINDGSAAGQTVSHLHIHLVPRYAGDVADPRGGVRGLIPDRAKYWGDK